MYIGRIGDGSHYDDGIYVLLKEVVDNAVDEFIMGYGDAGRDHASTGRDVTVRDFGRGIPLGKVVECVSRINTGAKYNDDVFQFSVGLNGVGHQGGQRPLQRTSACAAYRDGKFAEAALRAGRAARARSKGKAAGRAGRHADPLHARTPRSSATSPFREEHVARRLRLYTYLNAGLTHRLQRRAHSSPRTACST